MKPPEILAMIEEAAGTRMYEAKKQQAEKTIEKKDAKLKEINDILVEEINPTLTKLKEERSAYLEYQKIQRELEHLTKFYLAYKFVCAEEASSKTKDEMEALVKKLNDIEVAIKQGEEEIAEIEVAIKELERERDNEIGGQVAEKEETLREKEKLEGKVKSALKALKDNVKQEEKKQKQIEKSLTDDQKALTSKEKALGGMQEMFDQLREEDEKCQTELKKAQEKYQAISLGEEIIEGGGSATLQEQIMTTKAEISKKETEVNSADTKLKHNEDQLKKKKIEMKKTEAEYKRDSGALGKYEKEVQDLQQKLGKIQYEEGHVERLEHQQRQLRNEVYALKSQLDRVDGSYPQLRFQYQERGIDTSKVKGVAAKLFKVVDEEFCTGLQSVAGGKLYNIVVENDKVGSQLLAPNVCPRRVSIIPLNKIQANRMDPRIIESAKKLVGNNNVWYPLDLIEYDREFEPAMVHLFGNALLCRDLDQANKLADHKSVQRTCYTLDGDKASPSGDMSGGAPPRGNDLLRDLFGLHQQQLEMREKQEQLDEIVNQLRRISGVADQYKALSEQLDHKSTELELIRGRLQQTVHHQLAEDCKKLEEDTENIKDGVEQAKQFVKEKNKALKELEYKVKHAKELKEKELKAAEAAVKSCKKAAEASKSKWSVQEKEENSLKMELEDLRKSITTSEEQIEAVKATIDEWEKQINGKKEEEAKAVQEVAEAKQSLQQQKEILNAQNKEIKAKTDRKEKINKDIIDKGLEVQQLNHSIAKSKDEVKDAQRRVKDMLEEHEWINEDRKFFGQANTAYDFKATDPADAGKRIQKLESTKDKLSKSVNMRAMNMLGKAEEQYNDLLKKKKIVENDKSKIMDVISELDQKKRQALRQAWDQVNKDFGSIFSSLLPGATSKLEPPQGQDVLDGLEVKVAFGGVWKESLSELSGGQRSLVALSLILSLLLFKPAPLYILDEVDAALDLSHTQNIGQMLKTHFKHSQFIVVSLKDGMFNNANVLFRTKFVDGMSTVARTTQAQRK